MKGKKSGILTILKRSLFFLLFLISACAPSRFVETLDKGEHAAGLNLGGPLISFSGAIIPVPLSALTYGYGVDTNITVFGSLHTTSLLFSNLQLEAGAVFKVFAQRKYIPSISLSPCVNFITDFNAKATKFWPQADINLFWNHGKRNNCVYLGCSNWFELASTRAHNQEQISRWLFNPHLGYTHKGKKKWQYNIELKLLGLNHSNEYAFVPYRSIFGKHGATGLYFAFFRTF